MVDRTTCSPGSLVTLIFEIIQFQFKQAFSYQVKIILLGEEEDLKDTLLFKTKIYAICIPNTLLSVCFKVYDL